MSILIDQIAIRERSKRNKNHSIILQICKLQAHNPFAYKTPSPISPSVPLRHGTRFEYKIIISPNCFHQNHKKRKKRKKS